MSWRMMLRSRSGNTTYWVIDKNTNEIIPINLNDFMTLKQRKSAMAKPDFIWQFAQRLRKHFKDEGRDVAVYVQSFVSINGDKPTRLIDPKVDLASVPWDFFWHSDWILLKN